MIDDRTAVLFTRFYAGVALFVPWACAAIVFYWWIINTFTSSTEFLNPHLVEPQSKEPLLASVSNYQPGSLVLVEYDVIRHRDCTLEISRLMQRESDKREFLIQFVTQSVSADVPPFPRPSGYKAKIPEDLPPDTYKLFSRVRYYCNGLDWLWPRFKNMPPVTLTVD